MTLQELPDQVQEALDASRCEVAEAYVDADAYFFIGREYAAPVALEGALKMTEITDTYAEGFAAGELKHGPLALVTGETPVFALLTEGSSLEKTLGNGNEVEAREVAVVAVTDAPGEVGRDADHVLEMASHPQLTPVLATAQQG